MGKFLNHQQLLDKLRHAGENDFNVLMEGPAGTGKTSLVKQVAAELGLRLKYYSASTLDPFVDLVGLPTPVTGDDGNRSLVFHRQDDINQAELIFFDELNRAHSKVLNAVLEMIQFQTINGERLPQLKCVFAACNPPDEEYQVTELDPALVDRFHVHLQFGNAPDRNWFVERYGDTGLALCEWWSADLSGDQGRLISPRKLEHMAQLIERGGSPEDSMPRQDEKFPFHLLRERIESPDGVVDIKDFVNDPEKFESIVGEDNDLAVRFATLVPAMKPLQLFKVRMILLALPPELLSGIVDEPVVMKRLYDSISKREGTGERKVYRELLEEQLKPIQ